MYTVMEEFELDFLRSSCDTGRRIRPEGGNERHYHGPRMVLQIVNNHHTIIKDPSIPQSAIRIPWLRCATLKPTRM